MSFPVCNFTFSRARNLLLALFELKEKVPPLLARTTSNNVCAKSRYKLGRPLKNPLFSFVRDSLMDTLPVTLQPSKFNESIFGNLANIEMSPSIF